MSVGRVLDEAGNLQEHTFQIGGFSGVGELASVPAPWAAPKPVLPEPTAPAVLPVAPTVAAKVAMAPTDTVLSTKQLLSQLRARLRVVEREIKARKALEEERNQLLRLIGAAKQERDNLRRLRPAG